MNQADNMIKKERYPAIDGLRTFAALGIVIMHVRANASYQIDGFVYNQLVPFFSQLVFLFMIISGFSMCCGYYEKFKYGSISLNEFYSRRYKKILPFFTVLVILDLIVSPSLPSLYEGFADLTLCFALLPSCGGIHVIGVGWTLGIIFLFYMLFPFFCYLLNNKKRAWLVFCIALVFNYVCIQYFFAPPKMTVQFSSRMNFVYCAVFFIAGGLIYLYRDSVIRIVSKYRWAALLLCILITAGYFLWPVSWQNESVFTLQMLVIFSIWLMYAISVQGKILCNPVTRYISNISMEVYLSHMVAFRVVEKLRLTHVFSNDVLSYLLTTGLTLLGTFVFVLAVKWGIGILQGLRNRLFLKKSE